MVFNYFLFALWCPVFSIPAVDLLVASHYRPGAGCVCLQSGGEPLASPPSAHGTMLASVPQAALGRRVLGLSWAVQVFLYILCVCVCGLFFSLFGGLWSLPLFHALKKGWDHSTLTWQPRPGELEQEHSTMTVYNTNDPEESHLNPGAGRMVSTLQHAYTTSTSIAELRDILHKRGIFMRTQLQSRRVEL